MARERFDFLGPTQAEWFVLWWDQTFRDEVGPGEPADRSRPDDVDYAMEHCKEQMLIRRDVVKDENAPPQQALSAEKVQSALRAWERAAVPQLVPGKQWIARVDPREVAPPPSREQGPREAYLQ